MTSNLLLAQQARADKLRNPQQYCAADCLRRTNGESRYCPHHRAMARSFDIVRHDPTKGWPEHEGGGGIAEPTVPLVDRKEEYTDGR